MCLVNSAQLRIGQGQYVKYCWLILLFLGLSPKIEIRENGSVVKTTKRVWEGEESKKNLNAFYEYAQSKLKTTIAQLAQEYGSLTDEQMS